MGIDLFPRSNPSCSYLLPPTPTTHVVIHSFTHDSSFRYNSSHQIQRGGGGPTEALLFYRPSFSAREWDVTFDSPNCSWSMHTSSIRQSLLFRLLTGNTPCYPELCTDLLTILPGMGGRSTRIGGMGYQAR
jgi:hypothetical protein